MRADLRLAMIAALAMLAVAGCQEKKQGAAQGTAGGEVLPGSSSDAMLPIDTVRSQPPLAPKSEPSGTRPDKADAPVKPKAASPEPAAPAPPPAAAVAEEPADE